MDEIFFVDLDGNVIENKEYSSHIGLAKYILSNNKELLEEFNNSGYEREDLFLTELVILLLKVLKLSKDKEIYGKSKSLFY